MANKQVYYRLIALWVVCEAMLGGIIHGLKLPVSGLIVGSAAVICISLIGYYYPAKGSILKATIIVAIFKMMLSPQSPFAAYIAVIFQGVIGQLIFSNRNQFRFRCIAFAILALLESAIQRLLMMTILFGMDIWTAFNSFINGITGQSSVTNFSLYIASFYVILHIIIGFIVGNYASKIPSFVLRDKDEMAFRISGDSFVKIEKPKRKKKAGKYFLQVIWILLWAILIHSYFYPERAIIPSGIIIKLLLRSALIILTWILLINPLLTYMLHRWLKKKKTESGNEIKEISLLLPYTQHIVGQSWKMSSQKKGISRLKLFFRIVMVNSLIDA